MLQYEVNTIYQHFSCVDNSQSLHASSAHPRPFSFFFSPFIISFLSSFLPPSFSFFLLPFSSSFPFSFLYFFLYFFLFFFINLFLPFSQTNLSCISRLKSSVTCRLYNIRQLVIDIFSSQNRKQNTVVYYWTLSIFTVRTTVLSNLFFKFKKKFNCIWYTIPTTE